MLVPEQTLDVVLASLEREFTTLAGLLAEGHSVRSAKDILAQRLLLFSRRTTLLLGLQVRASTGAALQ